MFTDRIREILAQKGISQADFLRQLNLGRNAFSSWERAKDGEEEKLPNGATLLKIANFLEVSVDYLLGESNTPSSIIANEKISVPAQYEDVLVALNEGDKDLTQDDIDQIVRFIKFTREQKKN